MVRFNSRWLALEGHEFPAFQARIERDRVVRYLDFLGQQDAEVRQESACDDIGPALPTFPFSLEMEAGVVAAVAALLEIEASRLLHAEQSFTYHRPLRCGDLVTVMSWLRDVTWKPERRVCFFVKESHFRVDGRLTVSSRSVYAIRTAGEDT
ncbi:FAS1-like dehydratase domain-containing protein [Halomonas cerina]|uniref:FAS1-like dehydratase domain-containing protein n=1 Tax=Halomonas cerina TaxID=447424 RepID=A0A839V9Z4_9GAMM|nr:MaoC family dehydratase N-terminal domain-containing protein [Halomonas cerina]MBB3191961.1 hypothetical protein [Halomonas cerina]